MNNIDRAEKEMPVLQLIREKFKIEQPFNDLVIGCCLHITKETGVLMRTLRDGGAKVYLTASNPLSTQDDVAKQLDTEGIQNIGFKGMDEEQYKQGIKMVAQMNPHIIIDDGGDLTEEMLTWSYKLIGGLEETTTGVKRLRKWDEEGKLKFPMIAVNDSPTKTLFDNIYGTGQSTLDGILRATNVLLAGKTFVVAGYGHCGRGIATRARGMGCNVIVTEIDSLKALQAHYDGFRVMPMEKAAEVGDIFITATGEDNVINNTHFQLMKGGAILANAGHFDTEINVPELNKWHGYLTLLAEGRLVNLVCAEGHPSEVMDMSFANQALGAEYLVKYRDEFQPGLHGIPTPMSDEIAKLKLKSLQIEIDNPTR